MRNKMKDDYCSQCGAKQETLLLGHHLKETHYQNGDPIPKAVSNEQWLEFGKAEIGAYSVNENGDYLYNKLHNANLKEKTDV